MGDINVKLSAINLGKSLENLSVQVEEEIHLAVKNLANSAYAAMVNQIQNTGMDPKNRQDMLKGLKFLDLGDNSYVISLEGEWANKMESGYSGYDMKETLLKSQKIVQVGSRAGEPWVRTSKAGKKYAAVPMEHKPYQAQAGDLAAEIKKLTARNSQGINQKITKIFKDEFDQPIHGKAAVYNDPNGPANLQGLTKYQYTYSSGKVSSVYTTYRMISENSSGWQHPGFGGWHFFDKAEEEIKEELNNIIKALL